MYGPSTVYNHACSDLIIWILMRISSPVKSHFCSKTTPLPSGSTYHQIYQERDIKSTHSPPHLYITASAHSPQLSLSFNHANLISSLQWTSDSVWGKPAWFTLITKTSWCSSWQQTKTVCGSKPCSLFPHHTDASNLRADCGHEQDHHATSPQAGPMFS